MYSKDPTSGLVQYSEDLKFRLVWISNAQMIQILSGIWNPEPQPFEIQPSKSSDFRSIQYIICPNMSYCPMVRILNGVLSCI